LRRWLLSAERFNDSATARALPILKTPLSKSKALLRSITCFDQ